MGLESLIYRNLPRRDMAPNRRIHVPTHAPLTSSRGAHLNKQIKQRETLLHRPETYKDRWILHKTSFIKKKQ